MDVRKNYQIKWLDLKYLENYDHIKLQYLTYDVDAVDEKEAIERARQSYISGEKEVFSEELPFILKLFSVSKKPE